MPEVNELEKYSETLDLPFEVVEKYFQKVNTQQKTDWIGPVLLLLLIAGLIATAVFIFTTPALVATVGFLYLAVMSSITATFLSINTLFLSRAKTNKHIALSFDNDRIDFEYKKAPDTNWDSYGPPSAYEALKTQKNGKECVIFSGENVPSQMQKDLLKVIEKIISSLKEEEKELLRQRDGLVEQVKQNTGNSNRLESLNKKMGPIENELASCKKNILLTQQALDQLKNKETTEKESHKALDKLSTFIKGNENKFVFLVKIQEQLNQSIEEQKKHPALEATLSANSIELQKALSDKRAELVTELKKILLDIKTSKETLQTIKQGKSPVEVEQINQHIKNRDERLIKTICPFFEKELENVAEQDKATYLALKDVYFEHFPKDTKENPQKIQSLILDANPKPVQFSPPSETPPTQTEASKPSTGPKKTGI